MDQMVTFGPWLRQRRRFLGLTQEELAQRAACSLVTIRKMESGERRPSRQLAELLADCLAIPAEEREQFVAFARQSELAVQGVAPPHIAPASLLPLPPARPLPFLPHESDSPPAVSLPAPLTNLLGRDADIEAVGALLLRPSVRLVSLTGPGGTGKTRLAIEIARHLATERPTAFPDGLRFIDLASLMDPGLFLPALAEALGIVDNGEADPIIAVRAFLQGKRMLLVLDNFEQIVEAAIDLAEILQAAGGVKALITSRTVLRLYGEHEYPVAPLAVPDSPDGLTPDQLRAYPAIALFVERSRAIRPDFALTASNAADVRQICTRLDGLPLAIELAAARSKMFPPSSLLSQLTHSLDLAARQRNVNERQQTMRAAIDWSYRLLSADEQQLFRALGVFMNAFGLEEAKAITDAAGADEYALLDPLSGLVEKNMIRQIDSPHEARFQMLFVLREFALEQLESRGETDRYRLAHLTFFLNLARAQGQRMNLPDNEVPKARLMAANDDLRAAMGWAFERPDRAEQGMELAIALADYWKVRSTLTEGGRWIKDGLRILPPGALALRAKGLVVAARLANYESHYAESARLGAEALRLFQEMGDAAEEEWLLSAYHILGNSSADLGDFDEALRYHHLLLDLHRRRNNIVGIQQMIRAIGLTSFDMGQFDEAAEILQESIMINRQFGGWVDDLFLNLNALGVVELVRGHYSTARRLFEEAEDAAGRLGIPMWQAMILNNLGHLAIPVGDYEGARRCFAKARQLAAEFNVRGSQFQSVLGEATLALLEEQPVHSAWPLVRQCLDYHRELGASSRRFLRLTDVLALFCVQAGRPVLGMQLLGKAEALREQKHAQPRFANVQPVYERTMARAQRPLGQDEIRDAVQLGRHSSESALLDMVTEIGQALLPAG